MDAIDREAAIQRGRAEIGIRILISIEELMNGIDRGAAMQRGCHEIAFGS